MQDYPKSVKRKLRELSALAHEEELRRALLPLAQQFDAWRQGQIGSGELSALIHDWETGVSRDLFKTYNTPYVALQVAQAITEGILQSEAVPEEVVPYLQHYLDWYRSSHEEPSS